MFLAYQCFPNFRTCLDPPSAVLSGPTLPCLNTKDFYFLEILYNCCSLSTLPQVLKLGIL